MTRYSLRPDCLFDRPWRPGHPFRPKTCRARKLGMALLLVFLCLIIGGYGFVTDSNRVRDMAQGYLSGLLGGRVVVGGATLSLFEGLRLDDVKVYVDDPAAPGTPGPPGEEGGQAADAIVFSARSISISYGPQSMLRGELQATQIIAEKPQVHLTQDVGTGTWNFTRLGQNRRSRPEAPPSKPFKPMQLPELLLRNARVDISELRDGKMNSLGYVAIDGRLTPTGENNAQGYRFVLQSRGVNDATGPLATGSIDLGTRHVTAQLLRPFDFTSDIKSMLLTEVREWTNRHELAGRVGIPWLDYSPGTPDASGRMGRPHFTFQMTLDGVNLTVPAEELTSAREAERRDSAFQGARAMQRAYRFAGLRSAQGLSGAGEAPEIQIPRPRVNQSSAPDGLDSSTASNGRGTAAADEPGGQPSTEPSTPTPADTLAGLLEPTPLQLRHMAGTFVFTEDGIALEQVNGRVEGNGFNIDGHIGGYRPDAPMTLQISSLDSEGLSIPESPRYVWSLPHDYRDVYEQLRPQGRCQLQLNLTRPSSGVGLRADGCVTIIEGQFVFNQFAYPLHDVTGQIRFGREQSDGSGPDGWDYVRVVNLRGRGVVGGPNQDQYLTLNGRIGPIGPPGAPETGLNLTVHADEIHSEPPLMQAFSPEVRQALSLFDAPGKGQFPQFRGSFSTHVLRKAGANQRITYDTEIRLVDATAALVGFPYPLRHVAADVNVRDGYVDVVSAKMMRGNATLNVNGRVTWSDPGTPGGAAASPTTGPTALTVTVRNLPVDEDLLAALPADSADWIRKTGVNALLDVDGTLRAPPVQIEHPNPTSQSLAVKLPAGQLTAGQSPASQPTSRPSASGLNYDFDITLHDGTVRPRNGAFLVSGVGGTMHLTRDRLDLLRVHGRRGNADLSAHGFVTWPGDTPHLNFVATGHNLLLEPSLYALLPPAARDAWDELQPAGTLDAEVSYAPEPAEQHEAPLPPTVRVDLTAAPVVAPPVAAPPIAASPIAWPVAAPSVGSPVLGSTAPGASDTGLPAGFRATLKPRELTATLRTIPYRLDQVAGRVEITPDGVRLRDVAARHGKAKFTLSGTGAIGPGTTWDLKVGGQDVDVDADLHRALPAALTNLIDALKLNGKLGFRLDRFVYRPPAGLASFAAGTPAGTAAPGDANPEIDMRGAITLDGAKLDVGVPVDSVKGAVNFDGAVRDGRLRSLAGSLDVASLRMADRSITDFKAGLNKPADRPELLISGMQGSLAGGDLAGQATLSFPDDGPSRYMLSLVVRNADVKELAGETDQNLAGRLTASLALEGEWGKAGARRGRGDVVATGKEMYRIPVVLGLLQVTNLALPISSPFNSGIARYSVDGQKVTFEKIELRSNNMLMSGDGKLDFATRQVRMNFVTDNPGGFQVPIVQDLWRGAQHELLRIQVRGTVQAPKVETQSMGTLWTTVDEVLKGDSTEEKKPPHKHRATSQ